MREIRFHNAGGPGVPRGRTGAFGPLLAGGGAGDGVPYIWGRGAIAQLGERLLCKQEVTGSIPVGSIHEIPASELSPRVTFRAGWCPPTRRCQPAL